MAENSIIKARVRLEGLPAFTLDIPMRSGHEAFGFLAYFIAHIEGKVCPLREAYRVMAMDDAPPTLTTDGSQKRLNSARAGGRPVNKHER